MKSIEELVPNILRQYGLWEDYKKQMLFADWHNIVGKNLAKFSHIRSLNEKILTVVTYYPTVSQDIHMLKSMIINKINDRYGHEIINNIKILSGVKLLKKLQAKPIDDSFYLRRIPLKSINLNPEIIKQIENKVQDFQDEELRFLLRDLAIDIFKKKYYLKKENIKFCPKCHINYLDDDEKICFSCHLKAQREHIKRIMEIIIKHPNIKYEELKEIIPCTFNQMRDAKLEAMQFYINKLYDENPSIHIRRIVAMMMTNKDAKDLTEKRIKYLTDRYIKKVEINKQ